MGTTPTRRRLGATLGTLGIALVTLGATASPALADASGSHITGPGSGVSFNAPTTVSITADVKRSTLDQGGTVSLNVRDPGGRTFTGASTGGTGTLHFPLDTGCYDGTANCNGGRPAPNGTWVASLAGDGASGSVNFTLNVPPRAPRDLAASVDGQDITLTWTANNEPDLRDYTVVDDTGSPATLATLAPGDCSYQCSAHLHYDSSIHGDRQVAVNANRRTSPDASSVLTSTTRTTFTIPTPPPPPPPSPSPTPTQPSSSPSSSPSSGGSSPAPSGSSGSGGGGAPSGSGSGSSPNGGGSSSPSPLGHTDNPPSKGSGGAGSGGSGTGGSGSAGSGAGSSAGGSKTGPGSSTSGSSAPPTAPHFTYKPFAGKALPLSAGFSYTYSNTGGFAPNLPGVPDPFGSGGLSSHAGTNGGEPTSLGTYKPTLGYPDQYVRESAGKAVVGSKTRIVTLPAASTSAPGRGVGIPIAAGLLLLLGAAHLQMWSRRSRAAAK